MRMAKFVVMVLACGALLALADACAKRTPPSIASTKKEGPAATFLWSSRGGGSQIMQRVIAVRTAPDKRVWVAEGKMGMEKIGGRFFIFDPEGTFIEVWGSPGKNNGEFALNTGTTDDGADILFLPDGSFLVGDKGNIRIQLFDRERRFVRAWISGDGEPSSPTGLALTADGEVLVVFNRRPEIQRFKPDGTFLGMISAGLRTPQGICVDPEGRIWVADRNFKADAIVDGIVKVFDREGRPLFECGARTEAFDGLRQPGDLVADSRGRIYLADCYHHRGVVFDRDGKVLMTIGGRGEWEGTFNYSNGIALDGEGGVYVGDWTGGRLEKFLVAGVPD